MTNASSKAGLAALRRALNGAMVSQVEESDQHHDGIVLVLEGDDARRVTLWVDEAARLRVDVKDALCIRCLTAQKMPNDLLCAAGLNYGLQPQQKPECYQQPLSAAVCS